MNRRICITKLHTEARSTGTSCYPINTAYEESAIEVLERPQYTKCEKLV